MQSLKLWGTVPFISIEWTSEWPSQLEFPNFTVAVIFKMFPH